MNRKVVNKCRLCKSWWWGEALGGQSGLKNKGTCLKREDQSKVGQTMYSVDNNAAVEVKCIYNYDITSGDI